MFSNKEHEANQIRVPFVETLRKKTHRRITRCKYTFTALLLSCFPVERESEVTYTRNKSQDEVEVNSDLLIITRTAKTRTCCTQMLVCACSRTVLWGCVAWNLISGTRWFHVFSRRTQLPTKSELRRIWQHREIITARVIGESRRNLLCKDNVHSTDRCASWNCYDRHNTSLYYSITLTVEVTVLRLSYRTGDTAMVGMWLC